MSIFIKERRFVPRLPLWLHRWWADWWGFFWMTCPRCGAWHGGHQVNDRTRTIIVMWGGRGCAKPHEASAVVCPDCSWRMNEFDKGLPFEPEPTRVWNPAWVERWWPEKIAK